MVMPAPAPSRQPRNLADCLPNARLYPLPGQTHDLEPGVLGPVLEQFYSC